LTVEVWVGWEFALANPPSLDLRHEMADAVDDPTDDRVGVGTALLGFSSPRGKSFAFQICPKSGSRSECAGRAW
jgi:hypothetical protein